MRLLMKAIWRNWKSLVHRINDVIAFVLMALTYVLAVTPVALGFKILRRDLLDRGLGPKDSKTHWQKKKDEKQDISRVQRQY
jgi:hypothetical protein